MLVEHLHRDDVPETLALLNVLLGDRQTARPGYGPHESGADVDWEILADSDLSTNEMAVVHIAHGCAILERDGGGLPLEVRSQVLATVQTIIEVP
jgi:hypothetical protein